MFVPDVLHGAQEILLHLFIISVVILPFQAADRPQLLWNLSYLYVLVPQLEAPVLVMVCVSSPYSSVQTQHYC